MTSKLGLKFSNEKRSNKNARNFVFMTERHLYVKNYTNFDIKDR